MNSFFRKLSAYLQRSKKEAELREELHFHLMEEAEDRQAEGVPKEEAQYQSRREFGNLTRVAEDTRSEWGWTVLEQLLQDLRYAWRTFTKNPGFTTTALLILSIGIGANVAMFSVVNSVVLRPLPYPSADRLMTVWKARIPGGGLSATPADFLAWRHHSQSFSGLAAYVKQTVDVAGQGEPAQVDALRVSPNFFVTLGIPPERGRLFASGDHPNDERDSAVISARLAKKLAPDPRNVLGMNFQINGQSRTIIGILPASFTFGNDTPDVYLPLVIDAVTPLGNSLSVIGRLAPGVNRTAAEAELAVIAARNASPSGEHISLNPGVVPLQSQMIGDVRSVLLPLFVAVGCVLLIACATLASLQLVRATVRRKEMTVRAALGAGRTRLIVQMLIESVLLSVLGGAGSILITKGVLILLVSVRPKGLPRIDEVSIDSLAFGFALALSVVTGLLFGLVPALRASKVEPEAALREENRSSSSRSGTWLRKSLVVAQVALSFTLLTGAALLLNSFVRLVNVNPGFRAERLLTMRLTVPEHAYPDGRRVTDFLQQAAAQVEKVPGVQQVGTVDQLPLARGVTHAGFSFRADSKVGPDHIGIGEGWNVRPLYYVNPNYLTAMGTPLLSGRMFTDRDNQIGAFPVVIVNRTFVREFLVGDPLGQRVHLAPMGLWCTIIGVSEDMKNGGLGDNQLWLSKPPSATIYLPQALLPEFMYRPPWSSGRSWYLTAHTSIDPIIVADAVRRAIWAVAPSQPIADIKTMEQRVMESVATRRLGLWPLLVFAFIALALALVGIFGLVAYSVAQRTREIAVRIAVGASKADVLLLSLRDAVGLAILGLVLGLIGEQWLTRLLASQLFEISSHDLMTHVVVIAILLISVAVAGYIPARRATIVDPMIALRYE